MMPIVFVHDGASGNRDAGVVIMFFGPHFFIVYIIVIYPDMMSFCGFMCLSMDVVISFIVDLAE